MNKKYSIGFFIVFLAIIAFFALSYRLSYSHALDKQEAEAKENIQSELETCYYIKDNEGYVTVYESDLKTVYEYTSILVSDLPENIQKQVKEGIKVNSLTQVYGFLENYSS